MRHARTDYNARIQDSAGLIPDDEPVLLVRGQDAAALATCDAWIDEARRRGAEPEIVEAVSRHRAEIALWQQRHGSKIPDAPAEALGDGE